MNFINVYLIIFSIDSDFIPVSVKEGESNRIGFGIGKFSNPFQNLVCYWEFIQLLLFDAIPCIEENKCVGTLEIYSWSQAYCSTISLLNCVCFNSILTSLNIRYKYKIAVFIEVDFRAG